MLMLSRNLRAATRSFWRDVNPDARRLMVATMILSSLMMGVGSVTRALFVLRLGLGTEFFGTFNAFGAVGYMGLAVPAGMLSRHIGLKRSMMLGAAVFVMGFVGGTLVESLPAAYWVTFALAMQLVLAGGFAMFSVNASPAIMSTTQPHNRSKIYGAVSAARNFGTLVGMLVGGFLPTILARSLDLSLDSTDPYRLAMLSCAVIVVPGIYAITRFREERQPQTQHKFDNRTMFPIMPVGMILIYVIFSQGAVAVCHSFCNAYMDEELRLSPGAIGILGALGQLCAVIVPFTVPRLSRYMNNGNLLAMASMGTAFMLLPLSLIEHWAGVGLGRLGVMSLSAIWMPVVQIYQMEMVQREWRPLAFALLSVALGLNYGTLSYFGGRVISHWGYPTLFLICAGLTVMGSLALFIVQRLPLMQPKYAN